MQYTGNLKLKKPEGSDVVNIDDLNDNADIMDKEISKKVDKVPGKGLSTNDYTTSEKQKLAEIQAGANKYVHPISHSLDMITETSNKKIMTNAERNKIAGIEAGAQKNTVTSVAGKTGAVTLTKSNVGLGDVDNVKQATKAEFNSHVNGAFHIVESGKNSNGEYIKFADGTMFCYVETITLSYSERYTLSANWTFPVRFSSIPVVVATPARILGGDARDSMTAISNCADTTATIAFSNSKAVFSTDDTIKMQAVAIGRWK